MALAVWVLHALAFFTAFFKSDTLRDNILANCFAVSP
jgi:hypothetical protein